MSVQITKDENAGRMIEAFVESSSQEGIYYKVTGQIGVGITNFKCTCPAGKNGRACKHTKEVMEEI